MERRNRTAVGSRPGFEKVHQTAKVPRAERKSRIIQVELKALHLTAELERMASPGQIHVVIELETIRDPPIVYPLPSLPVCESGYIERRRQPRRQRMQVRGYPGVGSKAHWSHAVEGKAAGIQQARRKDVGLPKRQETRIRVHNLPKRGEAHWSRAFGARSGEAAEEGIVRGELVIHAPLPKIIRRRFVGIEDKFGASVPKIAPPGLGSGKVTPRYRLIKGFTSTLLPGRRPLRACSSGTIANFVQFSLSRIAS